jgi:type II secretion system protein I
MSYSNFPEPDVPRSRRGIRAGRRAAWTVRSGMTLLEVILAIAILGGSLAVLGELVRIGTRTARAARVLTTAQLLAESLVAEVTAGVTAPDPIDGVINDFGGFRWQYVVQIEQVDQKGLLAVAVTVREDKDISEKPVSFALVRWMIDPQTECDLEAAAAATASASSSGSESSSAASSSSATGTPSSGSGTGGAR